MVIASHASAWVHPSSTWMQQASILGTRGVELFYMVSAFTLFLSFSERSKRGKFSYSGYFIRRLARIAPMFWVALAIRLVVSGLHPNYWAPDGISKFDVLITALFINGWKAAAINSVVPGGWSVAVETSFYLLLPLCFLWVKSLRSALVATFVCLVIRNWAGVWYMTHVAHQFPPSQTYLTYSFAWEFWLPSQLPVFMLGIILYFVKERMPTNLRLGAFWLSMFAALIVASPSLNVEQFFPVQFICTIAFLCLALPMLSGEIPFLNINPLQQIGKVSFSAYLLHPYLMQLAERIASRLGFSRADSDWRYVIAVIVTATISAIVCSYTYRFIEEPGMKAGAWIIQKLRRNDAGGPGNSNRAVTGTAGI